MRKSSIVFALFLMSGCGGGGGTGGVGSGTGGASGGADMATGSATDMAKPGKMGDMALLSQCGHPGDTGNSLGVGKFCMFISDCTVGTMTTNICSNLGNGGDPSADDTYFCTIYPCKQLDGGASNCGENATCVCGAAGGTSGCACTPNSCLGSPTSDGGT